MRMYVYAPTDIIVALHCLVVFIVCLPANSGHVCYIAVSEAAKPTKSLWTSSECASLCLSHSETHSTHKVTRAAPGHSKQWVVIVHCAMKEGGWGGTTVCVECARLAQISTATERNKQIVTRTRERDKEVTESSAFSLFRCPVIDFYIFPHMTPTSPPLLLHLLSFIAAARHRCPRHRRWRSSQRWQPSRTTATTIP